VLPFPAGEDHVYVLHAVALTLVITGTHTGGFKINGDTEAGFGVIVAVNA